MIHQNTCVLSKRTHSSRRFEHCSENTCYWLLETVPKACTKPLHSALLISSKPRIMFSLRSIHLCVASACAFVISVLCSIPSGKYYKVAERRRITTHCHSEEKSHLQFGKHIRAARVLGGIHRDIVSGRFGALLLLRKFIEYVEIRLREALLAAFRVTGIFSCGLQRITEKKVSTRTNFETSVTGISKLAILNVISNA